MSEIITNRGGMVVRWLAQKVLGLNPGWDLSIWSLHDPSLQVLNLQSKHMHGVELTGDS